jgi:Polyketide cyclase / dehydrase and lipid transport
MSEYRQQAWIDAPIEVVWDLIRDVERHPEWWPRVVEVECEGLEEGCSYRQLTETPLGTQELDVIVDRLEELREMRIRCINTGTFVDLSLTRARGGTFIDACFGMDPLTMRMRVFDAVAGKRFFRRWLEQSLDAMQRVAHQGSDRPPQAQESR